MPMSTRLRVALGAASAVTALAVACAAGAQATTARTANGTAPARDASSIRSAAVTPALYSGTIRLMNAYRPSDWCLNAVGYGRQLDLEDCSQQSAFWTITRVSAIDSRGGAWVTLRDQRYGYCMDAQDNATGSPNTSGDHVNSWPCDRASQQNWYFWPLGAGPGVGTFMIVNGFNTNMVLDARTNTVWNPSLITDPVQLWQHVGTIQQSWDYFEG